MVYKNRIRVKEFFVDFDKLRCGSVHPNHFVSALGIAGLDRFLGQEGVRVLAQGYTVGKPDGLQLVEYRRFCDDVDSAFTQKVPRQITKAFHPGGRSRVINRVVLGRT